MAFFKLTTANKCDVILTYFNDSNTIVGQRSITFDAKPTFKELKNKFKIDGATKLRITTTPGCNVKTVKI